MAELCVMVADVLAGKAGEDVDTFDEKSKLVKFNDVLLAVGKFVDIATDWILVAQLHVGTFGPRPLLLLSTASCATVGSLVELFAISVLFRLKYRQHANPQVQGLQQTLLNRKLAWWRFGSDDLPTFTIGLFLLLGPAPIVPPPPAAPPSAPPPAACFNPCGSETCADVADIECARLLRVFGCDCNGCCALNASSATGNCEPESADTAEAYSTMGDATTAYAVVIVSLAYSVYALVIHLLRPPPKPDTELLKECYDAGIEVSVLEGVGFKLGELHGAGYYERLQEAKEAGYSSVAVAKEAGYLCEEVKGVGYTCEEARDGGYPLQEIKAAGYSCQEAKGVGYSCREAREAGYSPQEVKAAGYVEGLKEAGFSCQEVKGAGYSCREAREAGYSLQEVMAAGYVEGLKEAGFSCQEVKGAGYSCREAREAGYSPQEVTVAGYVEGLKEAGYTCKEAKEAGYTCREAKEASYTCREAKQAGYGCHEAEQAGWSAVEGHRAGYRCCGVLWHYWPGVCTR